MDMRQSPPVLQRCHSRKRLREWDYMLGWTRSIRETRPFKELRRTTQLEPTFIANIGVAGQPITSVAKGMYPRPPQLLDPRHMVTDDPPGESYWKVSNGIRMTGMPSFHESLSDTQMWQVSLLLANADKLPASANLILAQPLPVDQAAAGSTTAGNVRR